MLQITDVAHEKISAFLSDTNGTLRVSQLSMGGACGAKIQLGVTLSDGSEEDDEMFDINGLKVVIDRALHRRVGEIIIDYSADAGLVVRTCGCGVKA